MMRRTFWACWLVALLAGCGSQGVADKGDAVRSRNYRALSLDDVMAGNTTDTKLLMHFDDQAGVEDVALGRTTGGGAKIIQNTGTIQSSVAKWGKAAYFDGSTFVTIQPHADFDLGTGNWTMDLWAYPNELTLYTMFAWYQDADNYFSATGIFFGDQALFWINHRTDGVDRNFAQSGFVYLPVPSWTHFAIVRDSGTLYIYANGSMVGSNAISATGMDADFSVWPLYIGKSVSFAPYTHQLRSDTCYIDEFRVHKSAYWTADFTPPTHAYTSRVTHMLGSYHNITQPLRYESAGSHGMGVGATRLEHAGAFNQTKEAQYELAGNHRINPISFELAGGYDLVHHAQRFENAGQFAKLRPARVEHAGAFNQTVSMRLETAGKHNVTTDGRLQSAGSFDQMRRVKLESVGLHEIVGDVTYELYYAFGSAPNLDGTPWEVFTALPHTTAAITGTGFHYFVLRLRSKAGILSQNIATTVIELDASDNQLTLKPGDPQAITIAEGAALVADITADYFYLQDSGREADTWNIYITTNGVDPDPAVDTPIAVTMNKTAGVANLAYTTAAATEGDTVKAIVRALRTSDSRESSNVAVVSTTVTALGPGAVTVRQTRTIDGQPVQIA